MAKRVKVSDGKSVKVVATEARVDGDFVVEAGFAGFVIGNAAVADPVVINIEQAEYEIEATAVFEPGDLIAYDASLTGKARFIAADTTHPARLRATEKSDGSGVVWAILLPQTN